MPVRPQFRGVSKSCSRGKIALPTFHASQSSNVHRESSHLLGLGLGLLLDVVLGAALLGLAGVVLLLVLGLGGRVARDSRDGAAHGSRDAVRDAGAQVRELPLGLLLLALEVLVAALGLQRLWGTVVSVQVNIDRQVGGSMRQGTIGLTSDPTRFPTVSFAEPTVWL